MDTRIALRTRSLEPLTDRRTALRALVAGAVLTRLPMSALAQEATPEGLPLFTGETFVGETSDPETLVAIVLAGETGDEPREARGYLCNGPERTIDVWLTGEAREGRLALTAEDGSRLDGVMNAAGVGGGATLAGGTTLVFTALPATDLAGLYTVAILPDGRMAGESAAGGQLVGELADDAATSGDRYGFDVTITPPDGRVIPMTFSTATTDEGDFRLILLADGRGKGQGKTKRSGDWVEPDPQP